MNPNALALEGIQYYASLSKLPMKVDGVLLAVPPDVTDEVAGLDIPRGWMHKGAGAGAVSESAI